MTLTLVSLVSQLDYIQGLGFDAIWISPYVLTFLLPSLFSVIVRLHYIL